MLITGIVLVLATVIFTRLPPKNPEWEEDEKRC
jgi:hypothetical protein